MKQDSVSSLVSQVDIARIRADISRLAAGPRHSLHDQKRHREVAEYILGVFQKCGLKPREHAFTLDGRRGTNIMGKKTSASTPGLPSILVSAHYDTVQGSVGADDNASGVAALLECARVLSAVDLEDNLEFVAFDMEEVQPEGDGLVGSQAFVKDFGVQERYKGVYNLEMVGYTSGPGTQTDPPSFQYLLPRAFEWARAREFRGDFIATVAQGAGIELGRKFAEAAREWVPSLEVMPIEVAQPMPMLADIFRSDHAPFWAAGIPAIMITDTANFRNPGYHQPSDTTDTLDYDFLVEVTRSLVATLASRGGGGLGSPLATETQRQRDNN